MAIRKINTSQEIIGRKSEMELLKKLISLGRNILIEGPVGVGKTYLAVRCLESMGIGYERVDGDSRYTEAKLTGWFDPPAVLKKGYTEKSFLEGPLFRTMNQGQVLFINELNRMPEGVQNILLPAMDEGILQVPKLSSIQAEKGFLVVGTQNPKEFTATHALSEAILDRFELVRLDYQSREEECQIVELQLKKKFLPAQLNRALLEKSIDLIRASRTHASVRRGASIRAALSLCELVLQGIDFNTAARLALSNRIELVRAEESLDRVIEGLLSGTETSSFEEKKSRSA